MKMKKSSAIVCGPALVALALLSGNAFAVPTAIYTGTFGGIQYTFYAESSGITWNDANAYASGTGGMLAVVDTDAKNAWVASVVDANAAALYNSIGVGPWLGGECSGSCATLGNWSWVDGSAADRFLLTSSWSSGQPDGPGSEGTAMGLLFYNGGRNSGSLWGDYGKTCGAGSCGAGLVKGFVVQHAVLEPGALALFGLGLVGLGLARRRKIS